MPSRERDSLFGRLALTPFAVYVILVVVGLATTSPPLLDVDRAATFPIGLVALALAVRSVWRLTDGAASWARIGAALLATVVIGGCAFAAVSFAVLGLRAIECQATGHAGCFG